MLAHYNKNVFLVRTWEEHDTFTTQQSRTLTLKKGPLSLRMPEIHQLLLSGSVGSVWNDSSQFILLYPLEKGMQHAAVLVSPYSSPFLFTLSTDLSLVLDFDARLMNILWEWSIVDQSQQFFRCIDFISLKRFIKQCCRL